MNALKLSFPLNRQHLMNRNVDIEIVEYPVQLSELFGESLISLSSGLTFVPFHGTSFIEELESFDLDSTYLLIEDSVAKVATSSGVIGYCVSLVEILKETQSMVKIKTILSIGDMPFEPDSERQLKKIQRYNRDFYKLV